MRRAPGRMCGDKTLKLGLVGLNCSGGLTVEGRLTGQSTFCGYTTNVRSVVSLAMVAVEHATPGQQVTILWGEPNGGSRKSRAEEHRQLAVRATVAPAPYATGDPR